MYALPAGVAYDEPNIVALLSQMPQKASEAFRVAETALDIAMGIWDAAIDGSGIFMGLHGLKGKTAYNGTLQPRQWS